MFFPAKSRHCVAKVVKTFGCLAYTTETLDEFRYIMIHRLGTYGYFVLAFAPPLPGQKFIQLLVLLEEQAMTPRMRS